VKGLSSLGIARFPRNEFKFGVADGRWSGRALGDRGGLHRLLGSTKLRMGHLPLRGASAAASARALRSRHKRETAQRVE